MAGMNTTELCKRAGVHPSNISRWKRGANEPSYGAILKLEAEIEKANDAKKEAVS